jgi:hypothetical protein
MDTQEWDSYFHLEMESGPATETRTEGQENIFNRLR